MMIVSSVVPLVIAAYFYSRTSEILSGCVETQGTVVAVETEGAGRLLVYHPVFSFADESGKVHRARCGIGGSTPDYEIGDSTAIWYDREDPKEVSVKSFWHDWLGVIIPGVQVAILVIIGSILVLAGNRIDQNIGVIIRKLRDAWAKH
jgi:hypothetical protein